MNTVGKVQLTRFQNSDRAGSPAAAMPLADAQREVRTVFRGGSVGQFAAGAIWLVSAALSTLAGERYGILALVFGGMLIFPLTQLLLKLMGKPASLSRANPLKPLPLQSVFAMCAMYPLIYVATLHNLGWFYPAFLIVIGAHYLWFIFLYGMWQYGALAAALTVGGVAFGMLAPGSFSLAGWFGGFVLIAFSITIRQMRAWQAELPAHLP